MKEPKKQSDPVRNWREYNAALVERGSLTVWLDESASLGWLQGEKSGRRGASLTYSASYTIASYTSREKKRSQP